MKICHDAAHSDLDPLDMKSPECSSSVSGGPMIMEVSFEPSLHEMPLMNWESTPNTNIDEMHDHELGEFLSEAFGEPDTLEGFTI